MGIIHITPVLVMLHVTLSIILHVVVALHLETFIHRT